MFERIASEEIWQGHIGGVRVDTFRYDDGEEATREIVTHPGAVTVLPFDGEAIWLVRQPREPVDEQALLELPAGKIDRDGEELEDVAKRELAEEIGKGARDWRHLVSFYNSPGLLSEVNHLFLAEGLYDESAEAEEEERIEIVRMPLERLERDDRRVQGREDAHRAALVQVLPGLSVAACRRGEAGGRRVPHGDDRQARCRSGRSSTCCSTSSPTSSSSAACRATRSRPTAPTCSSTGASWMSAA